LYGAPYLAGETDFAEARKARKPLREFVREKYKLEEKKLAKAAAADQARVDAIVKEKVDAERAKLVAQYGSNPETRSPVASKFDKIEKSREASGKDSWKTEAGRKAARSSRLSRFENIQLQ
jgi:response regulator of citrate/malate metabolism